MLVPRKLVSALVAVMVLAPALLACALPGVEMSAEEKACCRHMAEQCGDPAMPESHSCCSKTISVQAGAFQIKQRETSSPERVGTVVVASQFVTPVFNIPAPANGIPAFSESPPGHSSILRI